MQIILLERVAKLGTIGDVVSVKDGYARNFLLPLKKAMRANEANKQVFETNRERLVAENADRRGEAETLGSTIDGEEIVLIRASSNSGQLYGSVNVRDIAAGLVEKGHVVDKKQVIMGEPIKMIGMFEVTIALHPEVQFTVKANVARSDDEAELQRQGIDIFAQAFEEDRQGGKDFAEAAVVDPDSELGDLPTDEAETDAEEGAAEAAAPAEGEEVAVEAASDEDSSEG